MNSLLVTSGIQTFRMPSRRARRHRDVVLTVLQNPGYRDAAGALARRIEHYQQQLATSMEIILTSLVDSLQSSHHGAIDATGPVEGASAQTLNRQMVEAGGTRDANEA